MMVKHVNERAGKERALMLQNAENYLN